MSGRTNRIIMAAMVVCARIQLPMAANSQWVSLGIRIERQRTRNFLGRFSTPSSRQWVQFLVIPKRDWSTFILHRIGIAAHTVSLIPFANRATCCSAHCSMSRPAVSYQICYSPDGERANPTSGRKRRLVSPKVFEEPFGIQMWACFEPPLSNAGSTTYGVRHLRSSSVLRTRPNHRL